LNEFKVSDIDGRLYHCSGRLATDNEWRVWQQQRVAEWIHDKDNVFKINGQDPRIGGGITWSRDQREARGQGNPTPIPGPGDLVPYRCAGTYHVACDCVGQ